MLNWDQKIQVCIRKVISDEFLCNNDKVVKYYIGLPSYEMLKAVYDLVYAIQQFLIVLIKLCVAVGDKI